MGVQVAVAFIVSVAGLWIAHIALLNQPVGRGLMYAIFWGLIATGVIVSATRTERARRLRLSEDSDAETRR